MSNDKKNDSATTGVRLDRWLWSTRFFKTRGIAAQAIKNGRVLLNDNRPKVSKLVHIGDRLIIRRDAFKFEVDVIGLAERRVSAVAAQALYTETEQSQAARTKLAEQLKASAIYKTPGRPTKRQRRELDRLRRND